MIIIKKNYYKLQSYFFEEEKVNNIYQDSEILMF